MAESFDPYVTWLDIRDRQRPPHCYALLGLRPLESDSQTIALAAERRIAEVRKFAGGTHAAVAEKLIVQLAAARACLLDPEKKADYDRRLRSRLAGQPGAAQRPSAESLLPPQSISAPARPELIAPSLGVTPGAEAANELDFDLADARPIARPRRSANPLVPLVMVAFILAGATVGGVLFAARQGFFSAKASGNAPAQTLVPTVREPAQSPATVAAPKPGRPAQRPSRKPVPAANEAESPDPRDIMPEQRAEPLPATEAEAKDPGDAAPVASVPQPPVEKLPIPTDKLLQEARKEIGKRFEFDYANAKSIVDFRIFGRKLYEAAIKRQERPESRFVMFEEARRLFVEGVAPPAALEAIEAQARAFQLDPLPLKIKVLEKLAPVLTDLEAQFDLVQAMLSTAEAAIGVDAYKTAAELSRLAVTWSKRLGDPMLDERIKDFNRGLRACQQQYKVLAPQRQALAENPSDAAAHTALGRFEALFKHRFDVAAEHLAAGEPGPWQVAGTRERAGPTTIEDKASAGDAWWEVAETLATAEQPAIRARARYWYESAIPELAGAAQEKLQDRVGELFGRTKIWRTGNQQGEAALGHPEADLAASATVELWFATTDLSAAILSKRGQEDDRAVALVAREGRLIVWLDNASRKEFDTRVLVCDGNWHHAALTREANRLRLYVDGRLIGRYDVTGDLESSSPWVAGMHALEPAMQRPVNGRFARIRLSNAARYQFTFVPERNYGKDRRTVFIE